MKFLRNLLDRMNKKTEKGILKPIHPLVEAVNVALFDPDIPTSRAPFVRDALNTKRYVFTVVIALSPVLAMATWYYGLRIPLLLLWSYFVGATVETVFAYFRKETISEGFLVTGLLFVLIFPVDTPLWMYTVSIVFGIVFGKEVFGGVGHNPFNPALVGRMFALISWPAAVSPATYIEPKYRLFELLTSRTDAVTSATPLTLLKNSSDLASSIPLEQLLLGPRGGSVGEISSLLLILGGLYLILIRVVNWRIPFAILAGSFTAGGLLYLVDPSRYPSPVFQLLAGGLLLGAFYMASDPVTSPDTGAGKWIYGLLTGVLVIVIRCFSPLVEGVMFSIILMNVAAPLIDEGVRTFRRRREARYE
ncbi:RnfABCDGE type electron transport complex subunit D [Myxococcota bacterium]|nr:RnfABCDGE type electron transport complex subunit D [Myxococcota bacterium]MBU1537747.1 RnfABCDGE type electron transport complex subunit D [Myxococcota bacterium]